MQPSQWVSIPINQMEGQTIKFTASSSTPANGTAIGLYEVKVFGRTQKADVSAKIYLEGAYNNQSGFMDRNLTNLPTYNPFYSFGYTNDILMEESL